MLTRESGTKILNLNNGRTEYFIHSNTSITDYYLAPGNSLTYTIMTPKEIITYANNTERLRLNARYGYRKV